MIGLRKMDGRSFIALTFAVLVTVALSGGMAVAAPVPSQTSTAATGTADAQTVAAERQVVSGALMDFGLSKADAAERVSLLTDEEVHALSADLDSVQIAGEDIHWDTTTVLLLLILVVLIVD